MSRPSRNNRYGTPLFLSLALLMRSLLILFVSTTIACAESYTIQNLGTLGGGYAAAANGGINASGQATGWSGSNAHAFFFSGSQMSDLGTLGGTSSYGMGINASGQVAGYSYISGNNAYRAFVYSNGQMTDIGTLGGTDSQAYAINDTGQVAGLANLSGNGSFHAFVYSNGQMKDLGTLGGTNSGALGINASGQITGISNTSGNTASHAFLYGNGQMTDLGTLGGNRSFGNGINTSGEVAGYSDTSGNNGYHAFVYGNGQMSDLGTLGGINSQAYSINDNGNVVGEGQTASGQIDAFIDVSGVMTDLNTYLPSGSTIRLQAATGINNAGQILADGIDSSTGQADAYLLTPNVGALAAPLPITVWEGLGLFGMLGLFRHFKRGSKHEEGSR